MKIYLDVTTIVRWTRPPVGIVKTLIEFSKFIINKNEVEFVILNKELKAIIIVPKIKVIEHIHNIETSSNIDNNLEDTLVRVFNSNQLNYKSVKSSFQFGNSIFNKELFAPEILLSFEYAHPFNQNDIYVSIGLDWDHSYYEMLYWLKKNVKFQFVGASYDVIPIMHPELVQSYSFSQYFSKYIYNLLNLSDKIFCISNDTKKQLEQFKNTNNITTDKLKIKTIHLADNEKFLSSKVWTGRVHRKKYILYVSTIEVRKNHKILFETWKNLINEINNKEEIPSLILVGMRGWGVDDLFKEYENNSTLQKYIHFYHDVDDNELNNLYEKSLFTVFPSFAEGWGLAVTESLMHKKMCIISDSPALKESSQNLMPVFSSNDIDYWTEGIKFFLNNPIYIKMIENNIDSHFKKRTWNEFSEDFYEFILEQE